MLIRRRPTKTLSQREKDAKKRGKLLEERQAWRWRKKEQQPAPADEHQQQGGQDGR